MTPTPLFRLLLILCLPCCALRAAAAEPPMAQVIDDSFAFATAQYARMLDQLQGKEGFPRTYEHGELKLIKATDWTSGFFPGSLWYLFEATGDAKWRQAAERYTAGLEEQQHNKNTHDVGFILYCSYGNGHRLTKNPKYRDIMLTGAASLSTRFNPTVGSIQSWPTGRRGWKFPVIIDNMMNLDLLMWVSKNGGGQKFADIAIAHADTSLKNHFRPDNSSVHVVEYDPATGAVKARLTHQGVADSSAWARGQAWGLYGYTLMHRETKKPEYLAQAKKIAAFIMNHPRLPADKIPYWDFDSPAIPLPASRADESPNIPAAPRDASAAAIIASALLELRTFVDAGTAAGYTAFAEQQLRALASPAYRAKLGANGCFLLLHCTGNLPAGGEIDTPINYGDYYFLEALLRYKAGLQQKA